MGIGAYNASVLTAEGKAASAGYARTIQGLEYIHLIDTRDSLGVPIACR